MTAKKKKLIKGLVAVALIAIIGIGATLAYLSSNLGTKSNKFTGDKNINGDLTEETFWNNPWTNYKPGDSQSKTPTVSLDANSAAAYVGMIVKCNYTNSAGEKTVIPMSTFQSQYATTTADNDADKDGINDKWVHIGYIEGKGDLYIYEATDLNGLTEEQMKTTTDGGKGIVDASLAAQKLDPIFKQITVNVGITEVWTESAKTTNTYSVDANGKKTLVNTATQTYDPKVTYENEAGEVIQAGTLPTFQMDVSSYAVQAYTTNNGTNSALGLASAQTQIATLANWN